MSDPIHDFESEIREFLAAQGVPPDRIVLSVPPEPDFGEASANAAFLLAKERRQAPRVIAEDIARNFQTANSRFVARVEAAGNGYINFFVNHESFVPHALTGIEDAATEFGRPDGSRPERVLVEHTSVNPNKEWHIGHLRNVVIGDVLVRIARLAGTRSRSKTTSTIPGVRQRRRSTPCSTIRLIHQIQMTSLTST